MPQGKGTYGSQKGRPKKLKDAGVLTPAQKKLPKDLQKKIIAKKAKDGANANM